MCADWTGLRWAKKKDGRGQGGSGQRERERGEGKGSVTNKGGGEGEKTTAKEEMRRGVIVEGED